MEAGQAANGFGGEMVKPVASALAEGRDGGIGAVGGHSGLEVPPEIIAGIQLRRA